MEELGLEQWVDSDLSYGHADITSAMLVPGTPFVRIGLLAILADVVAGTPPSGPVSPTTDLSIHMARPSALRSVHLEARVLKAGATLVVIQTLLTADDEKQPFATSLATFMNRPVDVGDRARPKARRLELPLGARIGARVLRPGTVELDPRDDIGNAFHGTVLGGVTAVLGELAAESVTTDDEPFVVTDLDIRFLNRVRVGPVRAVAEVIIDGPESRGRGVTISDTGYGDRIVAYVSAGGSSAW
jgi:acyl-coenzyme A thioesterase PaaI-like protein